ncbi:MAG: alkaline phosphatase family protein [Aggregatilineales bacterium]
MRIFQRPFRTKKPKRLMILGLDCAAPQLMFDTFLDDLPTIKSFMQQGTWGTLRSSTPCITIPAWSSMLTSRDPGELGFYGFRNRVDYSYDKQAVVNSHSVKFPRIWDYLSAENKQCFIAGVPQTYPPQPINGHLISGFLAPNTQSAFTYPAIFKQEILSIAPNYAFDVKDFRTDDKFKLSQQLFDLAEVQFTVLKHAIQTKAWDFFMHVNIGVDRVHHGFWRFHDPEHRAYEANSPYQNTIRDYYKLVDLQIKQLIDLAADDVAVLIVSDHGVKRMDGGICINEWLWRNGWLAFKTLPIEGAITRFDTDNVDWSKTRAWGMGGYYGRVYLNVAEREPQGIVPQSAFEEIRNQLSAELQKITVPEVGQLETKVMKPEDIYHSVSNIAPDLMVYFGNLHWRSVGSLGHGAYYTYQNDTGPDDANHAEEGLFIFYDPATTGLGHAMMDQQLMDIAPTILHHMNLTIPHDMRGKVIQTT